jgi:hypothetical protein
LQDKAPRQANVSKFLSKRRRIRIGKRNIIVQAKLVERLLHRICCAGQVVAVQVDLLGPCDGVEDNVRYRIEPAWPGLWSAQPLRPRGSKVIQIANAKLF